MQLDETQSNVYKEMPEGHWLSNPSHVERFVDWITFYRRNLHRFAKDYLGLKLYLYQYICLYFMGMSTMTTIVAARASAKSFMIAIFACCKCILFPGSKIVLTSGTRGQSKLIVTAKIQNELMTRSPNLCNEIESVVANQQEVIVKFWNGSTIETVTCSANSRGHRSTCVVGEEAREIDKEVFDTVISPFQIVRIAPYMALPQYESIECLRENPIKIYITSSFQETHWMYKISKNALIGMLNGGTSFFLAMDYSITLQHGIRPKETLIEERKTIDDLTWMCEYENAVIRTNNRAYFGYDMVHDCMVLKRGFYPRRTEDVSLKKTNKYAIPRQPGEMRVVACDIAAVDRTENDNSVFTCLRLLPESSGEEGHAQQSYHIQVPYLEGIRGQELRKQAIRIRQLYEDFEADYIVLDTRNMGVGIYDLLARVLYDDERGIEYNALKCMNDDAYANRIINPNAEPVIYCITASAKMNSEMATTLKTLFLNKQIDLMLTKDEGVDELKQRIPEYAKTNDAEQMLFFEKPYLETMLLVNELVNLEYEKLENTGLIRISEKSNMMKDRYSSVAMGCLFASKLARDLLNSGDEIAFEDAVMCFSSFD